MTNRLDNCLDRELLRRIAGFFRERRVDAYLVGGIVRDWLLGRPSQDLDLAVAGDALRLTRALADELDAAYVPLDMERATARAVLRYPIEPTHYIDVAQLRGDSLAADLADRDFTVNAMAVSLADAAMGRLNVVDPLDGQVDLSAGRLRAPSESAFRDDPLRLLRAVRLAAELDFAIEPRTQEWIAEQARAIREPAAERVRDELVRLFACWGTAEYLRLMDELGLLGPLFPELVAGKGVAQPAMHQWDVFDHSLVAVGRIDRIFGVLDLPPFNAADAGYPSLDSAYAQVGSQLSPFAGRMRAHLQSDVVGGRPRFVLLKFLTSLHDVGKPRTRSIDEAGEIHFYRHEQVGADMVAAILSRLHFGALEVKIGRTVTLHHMRPKWLAGSENVTSRAIYRFFRDTSVSGLDVILLSLADTMARGDGPIDEGAWEAQLDITERLLSAWFERRDSVVEPPALVRGSDLMETFDLVPGPIVGELLEAIREAQVVNRVSDRDDALAFAREWLASDDRRRTSD
ncbi:MAG: HD domain-containing protein [Anaerolineae bacterium]